MSTERIQRIQHQLDEARRYLDTVLDNVGDRWETQIYSDGLKWTVRQLTNHLAEADRGHNAQVMNIVKGRDIIPEDFDIERYNRRITEKTAEKSGVQAREDLTATRQQLQEWLFTIDPSVLDKKGRHASLRILTVEQILGVMADHERNHAKDIAAALNLEV